MTGSRFRLELIAFVCSCVMYAANRSTDLLMKIKHSAVPLRRSASRACRAGRPCGVLRPHAVTQSCLSESLSVWPLSRADLSALSELSRTVAADSVGYHSKSHHYIGMRGGLSRPLPTQKHTKGGDADCLLDCALRKKGPRSQRYAKHGFRAHRAKSQCRCIQHAVLG